MEKPVIAKDVPRRKILILSEPGKAGVKRHVCDIIRNIDLDRFEVLFGYSLSRADATYREEIESFKLRGITCVEIGMQRSISVVSELKSFLAIRSLILKFRPDIVHCHSAKAGFLGRLASRVFLPSALRIYTPNAMPCYFSRFYLLLEKACGQITDWMVASSESERSDIVGWKILPSQKIVVCPLGVKSELPTNVTKAFNEVRWIGSCGRICSQKGALLFFQAGIQVLAENPNVSLKWIGDFSDDEESRKVQRLIENSPLRDRISVTGWIDSVSEEMRTLDIFCIFSKYESYGYVTADAMALNIPVVGTKATGNVDLIKDRVTGMLVDVHVESIVKAVRLLISNEDLRHSIAKNARSFIADSHNLDNCLRNVYDLYQSVRLR